MSLLGKQRHFTTQFIFKNLKKKKKKKGRGTRSSRQAIKYDYNGKSKEKQDKETISNIDTELASSLQHHGDSA